MKILISWVARNNDFKDGKAIKEGPVFQFHEHFFNHDKHIILYATNGDETRVKHLESLILRNFKERVLELECLNVSDPINVNEIKTKIETFLLRHSKDEIDIFISPGTPAMQVSWYLCHMNLGLQTTLYQTRAAEFTESKKPELIKVDIAKSTVPVTSILFEESVEENERETDYIITDSIKQIYDNAKLIAQTDQVTALILGESGTGKEHLAHFIHQNSVRRNREYLTVNCSALSDQLLESRLFGYRKGAFTGADKNTPGLLEEANGGTIFLDEIGDISPYMQQSLLRVLQSKEIMPIGGKSVQVDVRIIAATNKNLPKMCEEGKFRWDLYYRLSVVELMLPTLQKRGKGDLQELINFFLGKKKKQLQKGKKLQFTKEAMQVLLNYHYPGNIRELENLIARLYVYHDEKVDLNNLPEHLSLTPMEQPLNWAYVEKEHIKKVLKLKNGNQRQTAIALGIVENTLRKKMEEYKIEI
jgi:transcriptional regulator with PAS, ATPase and Fis domain